MFQTFWRVYSYFFVVAYFATGRKKQENRNSLLFAVCQRNSLKTIQRAVYADFRIEKPTRNMFIVGNLYVPKKQTTSYFNWNGL